jgi:hypothetical protein
MDGHSTKLGSILLTVSARTTNQETKKQHTKNTIESTEDKIVSVETWKMQFNKNRIVFSLQREEIARRQEHYRKHKQPKPWTRLATIAEDKEPESSAAASSKIPQRPQSNSSSSKTGNEENTETKKTLRQILQQLQETPPRENQRKKIR